MQSVRCFALILMLASSAESLTVRSSVNPIRRVVTMLQMMSKQVEAEGKKEEALFQKFMCYCKNGKGALEASTEAAKAKIEELKSSIGQGAALLTQTKADLKSAQESRAEAKEAIENAVSLREKEATAYAKESGDFKTNIAAMKKAVAAISKGMGETFLQTRAASVVKKLSVTLDMSPVDRDMLTSFLTQSEGYAPASGEIVGILKQMTSTMEKDLAEATDAEEHSIKDFDGLMAAKTKELNTLTKEIETKIAKIGELGVEVVTQKEDLDDTSKSLAEDEAFLKDLEKNCKTKEDEWEVRCKIRAEETLAIADTVKILNDDDALDMFKKTLPTPSLIQITESAKSVKSRALVALHQRSHGKATDFRLNLISLALKGKKVSFEKVIGMIEEMTALLKKEQDHDDEKKQYCEDMIDKTEDKVKELELTVSDLEKHSADTTEGIATLASEIEALEDGIKKLDKQVAQGTEVRKEEHADAVETITNDSAAKEVIGFAKNRLNKFYNPKMYKPAPKRELTEEERITVNMGGTLAPTAAPGGIAGTGVTAFAQGAPPPPPETFGAYAKKSQESNGVLSMMDIMVADLDKEITETEVDEKDAQAEYEQFMKDSAEKRSLDAKSIEDKEGSKADLEAKLLKVEKEKKSTMKEAMATHESLAEIHGDCDWLLTNFETRKEARAGEVESLTKASAVLSGADYSLLQRTVVHHHKM